VPPKFSKKGRAANSYHPATSGAQNTGEPKAHEGGQTGVHGGASPHGGGPWGVASFTPTEVSLFEKGRPAPTLIKAGWRGRSPLPGGLGDVPPKFSKKGRAANSYHPATSGAQYAGKP
jgi:hypothetical protein